MEDREADQAPLSLHLIRRMFAYTRPYARRRNWLFFLTLLRGAAASGAGVDDRHNDQRPHCRKGPARDLRFTRALFC